MKSACGFTLIELMTTLTVAAILLLVGVPSFQEFSKGNSLSTLVNQFVADLNFTRSEAIKRSGRVTMCRSSNSTSCDTTTGVGWEKGWIIFSDQNGTAGSVDTGDTIVRTNGPPSGNITIRGNGNTGAHTRNRVSFASSGVLDSSPGSLIICDDRVKTYSTDKYKARVIIISKVGRIRTSKGSESGLSITSCTPS